MDAPPLRSLYGTLERYAGWLDRERPSAAVRACVHSLGAALDADADASVLLSELDTTISRLPGGEVRKMLRVTARQIRRALDESR